MEDLVLQIDDQEAGPWMAEQIAGAGDAGDRRLDGPGPARSVHLLLGDSVARRAPLVPKKEGEDILCRARGGETWSSLFGHLDNDLAFWRLHTESRERELGSILVWLSGNDVYSRLTGLPSYDEWKLADVGWIAARTITRLRREGRPLLILGPLPRPDGEVAGTPWSHTASYHLERRLVALIRDRSLGPCVKVCALGRALTKKIQNKKRLENCWEFFLSDRIHLSAQGYQKVARCESFPEWLCMSAGK